MVRNNVRVVQQRTITQGPDWMKVFVSHVMELRSWLVGWGQLTPASPHRGCERGPSDRSSPGSAAAESEASGSGPWSPPAWSSSAVGETSPVNSLGDESLEEDSREGKQIVELIAKSEFSGQLSITIQLDNKSIYIYIYFLSALEMLSPGHTKLTSKN